MRTLPRDHARAVGAVIGRQLNYLGRLRNRMERTGCVPGDRLYQEVTAAHNAVHTLSVQLHYQSIGMGRFDAYPPPMGSAGTETR